MSDYPPQPPLLSRTLDLTDYDHFKEELRVVDAHGIDGQHPHRRWEYALALHAIHRWSCAKERRVSAPVYDVGGAGSNFIHMLGEWTDCDAYIIDPLVSEALEMFVRAGRQLADVVTCISVVEHIKDLDRFLYYLSQLVAPGGLVVLTMDFWNRCGPDLADNHDLRERIFCPKTYAQLRMQLTTLQLVTFGGLDPSWHGAHVHDYTFASLVVEKRR